MKCTTRKKDWWCKENVLQQSKSLNKDKISQIIQEIFHYIQWITVVKNIFRKHFRIYATRCRCNRFSFHLKNLKTWTLPKKVYPFEFHTAPTAESVTSITPVLCGTDSFVTYPHFNCSLDLQIICSTYSLICSGLQKQWERIHEDEKLFRTERFDLLCLPAVRSGLGQRRTNRLWHPYMSLWHETVCTPSFTLPPRNEGPLSLVLHLTTLLSHSSGSVYVVFYHYDKIMCPGDVRANLFHALLI